MKSVYIAFILAGGLLISHPGWASPAPGTGIKSVKAVKAAKAAKASQKKPVVVKNKKSKTVAVKAKKAVKSKKQVVRVDFDAKPTQKIGCDKNAAGTSCLAMTKKPAKLSAFTKTGDFVSQAQTQNPYWSMRCINGYVIGNQAFCATEDKPVAVGKKARRSLASRKDESKKRK